MFDFLHSAKNEPSKAWNSGKLVGPKKPLRLKEIWAIQALHKRRKAHRDLALLNLGIDSKLRGGDLVAIKVCDIRSGEDYLARVTLIQQKTQRPVIFEITQNTQRTLEAWIEHAKLSSEDYLFPGRAENTHITRGQYSRLVKQWVKAIGSNPELYATHSIRRTKPTLIYRETKDIRTCQLLLGHTNLDCTVRYLGVEVDDAIAISENIEI